jgi:hypothetical protein
MRVGPTWIDPIPEPDSIVVWTTSEVEYDTQDDESGDSEYLSFDAMNTECPRQSRFLTPNLNGSKPEFTLPIHLGSE